MNQLLQAWYASILLFLPKNLKLFLLVTAANSIRTYTYLCKYALPLFIFTVLAQQSVLLSIMRSLGFPEMVAYPKSYIVPVFFILLWLFMVYLCARPSILQKNYFYFKQYVPHLFYFFAIMLLAFFIQLYVLLPLGLRIGMPGSLGIWFVYNYLWLVILLFPLFLLDSDPRLQNIVKTVIRSFKMAFYNLPALFILFLIASFVCQVVLVLFLFSPFLIYTALIALLPAVVCMVTTIYIKKIHEQFALYFKK